MFTQICAYLVQRSVPTDKGARCEEDHKKNAEAKDGPVPSDDKIRQAAQDVHEKDAEVEHPQVVSHLGIELNCL